MKFLIYLTTAFLLLLSCKESKKENLDQQLNANQLQELANKAIKEAELNKEYVLQPDDYRILHRFILKMPYNLDMDDSRYPVDFYAETRNEDYTIKVRSIAKNDFNRIYLKSLTKEKSKLKFCTKMYSDTLALSHTITLKKKARKKMFNAMDAYTTALESTNNGYKKFTILTCIKGKKYYFAIEQTCDMNKKNNYVNTMLKFPKTFRECR